MFIQSRQNTTLNCLPTPTYPLRPPRFRTRNIPDFFSPQLMDSPKSVSKTQVECTDVIPEKKKKPIKYQFRDKIEQSV